MSVGAGESLVVLLIAARWVGWIIALVEVVRIPDPQFDAAGTSKTMWIVLIVLTGIIGTLIWWLGKRSSVVAAVGPSNSQVPPGWYPEPGSDQLRWWDGYRWTDTRQPRHGP